MGRDLAARPGSGERALVERGCFGHVMRASQGENGRMNPLERVAYDLGQVARVAWFYAHAQLAGRVAPPIVEPAEIEGALPTLQQMMADLYELFRRDRANIEAGYYRLPHDLYGSPRAALAQSLRFLSDLGRIDRRRRERIHDEVRGAPSQQPGRYPDYYVQNFHYQTDGYLSDHSAALYDFQVEVLFKGSADAMRRQALLPIVKFLRGRPIRAQRLLDVACGTGRFLAFVKQNYPRLAVVGVDLSPAYLRQARRDLGAWSWVHLTLGAAEALPFPDASFDLVSCVYLFHELPRAVRERASAEFARVLHPGGRLVLVDSFQRGDEPAFDGLLELFPLAYHEPYYADYVRHDLRALFQDVGLDPIAAERAHMSKVMTFDKPD
jgi:ubiquinone/menaquinone biosynthesis C-methylase UbiE